MMFTESQNHRTEGVGSDLWRSSSPTPLLKQVHLDQVAKDCIQAGWIANLQIKVILSKVFF